MDFYIEWYFPTVGLKKQQTNKQTKKTVISIKKNPGFLKTQR